MKTSLHVFRAAELLSLGALFVLAGCTSVPMRQSTLPLETESTPTALEMSHPGYRAPAVLQTVDPQHPWELRRLGIPGAVKVNLMVDETGRVTDARVASSSDPAFDDPTLAALRQWTFKPASLHGVPYASRVSVPIQFELK
jgi:TonB family protein